MPRSNAVAISNMGCEMGRTFSQDGLGNLRPVDYASPPMRPWCVCLCALLIVPASLDAQAEKLVVRVTAVLDGDSPFFDAAICLGK